MLERHTSFTVASGGSTPVYMTPGTQLDRETVDALSGIIASSCQQHRDLRKEEQARSQKDREANYWEDRVEEWRLTGTLLVGLTVCASLITVATDRSNNSLRREIKELRSEMKDMNAVPTVTCEVGAGSQSEQPDGTLIRVDLADSYADKDDAKDDSNGVCSAFAFIPFEEA
ncbi:uncharacterized protein L199_000074 [Kwoniella botswanensis]|uniref:uncharacterized protein n=1 Tax=Kwoniella botswanensis TaxID=1268659 RepID=UPI00315D43C5